MKGMQKFKQGAFVGIALLMVGLAAGCGSTGKTGAADSSSPAASTSVSPPKETANPDPVTVKMMGYAGILSFGTPEDFKKYVQDPVQKKYPYITVQYESNGAFDKVIASGQVPDIFVYWYDNLNMIANLKALVPLDPFMKKYNFDQSQIAPDAWESVKNLANSDKIMVMPIGFNRPALFYNKDIFDKFGVAYPTSGMTFQQASELGKRMDQTVDGVQYIGFHPQSIFRAEMERNLPYLDPKTGKFAVNTDDWAKLYTMMKNIYQEQKIPSTMFTDPQSQDAFGKGQIGMLAASQGVAGLASKNKLNWDMTTYPQNPDKPGYTWRDDGMLASITPNSKNQDAAFKVLQVITSPEVQKVLSEDGNIPVLNNKDVQEAFGKSSPVYQGKNVGVYFSMKSSAAITIPNIKGSVSSVMDNAFWYPIISKGLDVNTALSQLNEQLQSDYDAIEH